MLRPLCSLGLAEVLFGSLKYLRDTSKRLNISTKCWEKDGEIFKCDLVLCIGICIYCIVVYIATVSGTWFF